MSAEACVVIRLRGPLQAWGSSSVFNWRDTGTAPTRSGIAGICCAALGLGRGTAEETDFLRHFAALHMKAVSIPPVRPTRGNVADAFMEAATEDIPAEELQLCRITDYHTVLGAVAAKGKSKPDASLTYRQYLADSRFLVFLTGNEMLVRGIDVALADPVWGVWLGRKCCIPSEPLRAGLYPSLRDAESAVLQGLPAVILMEEDSSVFGDGTDTVSDVPMSFRSTAREFRSRRVSRQYS